MGFKLIRELVLYNSIGCEISREQYKTDAKCSAVLLRWSTLLQSGDRIEAVERESEED